MSAFKFNFDTLARSPKTNVVAGRGGGVNGHIWKSVAQATDILSHTRISYAVSRVKTKPNIVSKET